MTLPSPRRHCGPRRRPRISWCCLAILLWRGFVRAGEYGVTSWGVDEGLPQSSVTDIAQTPDGFLWISSLLSGLSRFDGARFVNFDSANTPELVNSGVRRLLVDKQGNLWVNDSSGNLLLRQGSQFLKVGEGIRLGSLVGERGGRMAFATLDNDLVLVRRGGDGRWNSGHYKPPFGIGQYNYHEDAAGVLWFFTPAGKLGRFVDDKFSLLDSLPGLAGKKIQTLANDDAGQIWVGTETEIARWTGGTFTNCNPEEPGSKFSVRRMTLVPGGFWVEANNRLYLLDHGQWHAPVPEWDGGQPPWSHVRTARADGAGGIWFSLADEGLAHADHGGQLVRMTSADGLPSQLVQAFFCDRQGNLWAGYHRGGLIQLRQQTFHSVARAEGLLDTLVTSVTEDTAGAIWVGTAGGSVVRWKNGVCENLSLPRPGQFCQDVVVCGGPDGRVWIGTGGNGLLVWDNGAFRQAIAPDQLVQLQGVRQLVIGKNGLVWFANLSGLYQFDGQTTTRVMASTSTAQAVASLAEAPDGSIWFGTFGGVLYCRRNGKVSSYHPFDNMPASRIWFLLPEADGTVWAGTMNAGLLRFKDGEFLRFTKADGLADNYISHILADDLGNLWLGSSAGVMQVSKKSLAPKGTSGELLVCRLWGRSDGLPTVAMTLEFQPSCVKTHDGTLWFGSPKGASWVRPDEVRPAQPAPNVMVESVLADRSPREFSKSSGAPALTVKPGEKYLDVVYTAPDFIAPDLIRFKYRLAPLDSDWVDAGSRRAVNYNHLPVGEYTFRVTAGNSDGAWNSTGAGFRLVVQPYFWERKSFQVCTLLALLAAVAWAVRRLAHQRLRRRLELLHQQQQVEHERARIAQDLHDDLGAGLTEISLTSDFGRTLAPAANESGEYFHEIGGRARELVQRLDEIVWAVNPRNDSINSLTIYACEYAQQLLKAPGIACRFDLQPDLPELNLSSEQRYNLFLAFKETVNNVARHSRATELQLQIHADCQKLCFVVTDNGCGFDPAVRSAGADGLRNIRQRIERLGGQCEISSQPGQGTRVAFWIPVVLGNGAGLKSM